MGERSGAPRASALHQLSFRNLRLRFNYRSQMSQLTVTHPNAKPPYPRQRQDDVAVASAAAHRR